MKLRREKTWVSGCDKKGDWNSYMIIIIVYYFFLNYLYNRKQMSKYDQEFDFDDYDPKPAKKAKDSKKAKKKEEDDFFDLDDQYSKPNKLPVINPKPSKDLNNNPSTKNNKPSKNIYDDYEEIYQEVEDVSSPKKKGAEKKEV